MNRGSPERPLPDDDIEVKFLNNVERVHPVTQAKRISDMILGIAEIRDLRKLTDECVRGSGNDFAVTPDCGPRACPRTRACAPYELAPDVALRVAKYETE